MHKLAIMLMFVAIIGGLIPSVTAQQKSIIKYEQDFNDDTLQVFNELFEDCPAGTVLYKLNGEMVIVCLIDSTFGTIINNIDGSQTIDINVHVDNHKKKSGNHGGNHNETQGPDEDCLYNASLPKCAPDQDGDCPDGFNMNEDGNCFPDHSDSGCPDGTHGVDDDETGQCYKDDEVDCPDGMELNDGNCRYVNEEEEEPVVIVTPPPTEETVEEDNTLEMASDDEATPQEEDNNESVSTESSESNDNEEQPIEEEENN